MLLETLNKFKDRTVLVVGDIMLDEYIYGDTNRISPEAPVPIITSTHKEYRPGGAANVAMNIAALGGSPILCGFLAVDDSYVELSKFFQENKITVVTESPEDYITTTKTRIISRGQQIVRLDREFTRITDEYTKALINKIDACFDSVERRISSCVISDYGKGVASNKLCEHVINICNRHSIPVLVDPKGADYSKYRNCTLIKPNEKEASDVYKLPLNDAYSLDKACEYINEITNSAVLITRGSKGMHFYYNRGEYANSTISIDARKIDVADITGAGDTVISALSLFDFNSNVDMYVACALAALAADVSVSKHGTATCTLDELKQLITDRENERR